MDWLHKTVRACCAFWAGDLELVPSTRSVVARVRATPEEDIGLGLAFLRDESRLILALAAFNLLFCHDQL